MNAPSSAPPRLPDLVAFALGLCAVVMGCVTLTGWFANLPRLTDWNINSIAMFANTALMAVCAGTALMLLATRLEHGRSVMAIRALGGVVMAIACATLFEHVSGLDLGIDNLLVVHQWGQRAAVVPGRPGPPASSSFTLLGVALVLATLGGKRQRLAAAALAALVAMLALVNLSGFLFGAKQLYGVAHYTGIAFQSALIILGLATGVLAHLSDQPPMRTLCAAGGAGLLARRATPAVIGLPLVLGWLHVHGQAMGWFDDKLGTALLVTMLIMILGTLLWWCADEIALHEKALQRNEAALRREIAERQAVEGVLERRVREQAALYQFVDRLHRADSQQESLEAALDCVMAALGCDRAAVLLFDRDGAMRFAHWQGLSEGYRRAVEGHSPWQANDAGAQPLCIADVDAADLPEPLKNAVKAEGIRALAFIPLVAGGRLTGKFMTYYDQPRPFPAEETELALAIARQLGFGLQRKQAEEALRSSEAMLRSITDHSQDVIFVKDRESRMLFMNPAGLRMTGLGEAEVLGRTDAESDPLHAKQAEDFMAADRRVMESGQAETIEEEAATATGQIYTLLTTKTPRLDADGQVTGIVGISRDVTERKRTEQQLREAAKKAEEASRAKDDFLAALSHELRTPLTPALMTAEEMEADPTLSEEVREAFAVIRRNIHLEARLIDDLLDLTRITRGKLTLRLERTDLHRIIVEAEKIVRSDASERQVAVRLEMEAAGHHVHVDAIRLQQVLWNLLKNAIKFTPEGGSVEVRTWNPQPDRVEVQVRDSGIGIAPEVLGSIFRPFDQGQHGSKHQFGGLGLGLTISKAIIEQHHGSLRAESDGVGRGATFVIALEVVRPPEEAPAAPSPRFVAAPVPQSGQTVRV